MMRLPLLGSIFLFSISAFAQQTTTTTAASDPQAVAVVQAAIAALGGAPAISSVQSWTFQAQAEGRIANGTISEGLASSTPVGITAQAPPPWATPRSFFVPALVGAILAKQSQDSNFVLKQAASSPSVPNSTVVVFTLTTKTGRSVPAQSWYFDSTTNVPKRIDFIVSAKVGPIEAFPGTVILSNYQAVGGVLYPFQIVTFLQRQRATQTITLQSVTPSTTAPSTTIPTVGGAL